MSHAKLALLTYQFLLPAFNSDISLRSKFTDNGKSDYAFWIAGIGRDTNHLIDESQEAEITPAQEAGGSETCRVGLEL